MATRGRKPLVDTDTIVSAIFNSEDGALSAKDLGITPARAVTLCSPERGVLKLYKRTRKVVDAEGNPQRGRPAHLFGLTRRSKDRAKRASAQA